MTSAVGNEEVPPSMVELDDRFDEIAERLPSLASRLPKHTVVHLDPHKAQTKVNMFEQALSALYRDGAVIIDNAVAPELCDQVRTDMQPYLDRTAYGDDFLGHETKRAGAVIARSKASWPMAQHSFVMQICEAVLSRQILKYPTKEELAQKVMSPLAQRLPFQMHVSQVISIGPGNTWQAEHRDAWIYMHETQQYEQNVGVMWALSDFTKENGATRLYPGSHRLKGLEHPGDSFVQAVMRKGSCLIWLGTTWHSGGQNVTKENRYGLTIQYNLSFLRQEENQYLSCPPSVVQSFPRELQELIGYSMPAPGLGYYQEYKDPKDSCKEERSVDHAASKL